VIDAFYKSTVTLPVVDEEVGSPAITADDIIAAMRQK